MTNKEIFIQEFNEHQDLFSEEARSFVEGLSTPKERPVLTENGAKILEFMLEHKDEYNNIFKSKDIAEGLCISSRSVSGSMQKLLKESFCEKLGGNPVCYQITDAGAAQVESSF